MDFDSVEYICGVIEEKNVTRAAKKLNITQSALSKAIAKVELELGVKLFERQGRELVVNENGLRFYAWGKKGLSEYFELREKLQNNAAKLENEMVLLIDHMYSMRNFLISFRVQNPQYNINVKYQYVKNADDLEHIMKKEGIRAAITGCRSHNALYNSELLFDNPYCLIVNAEHPLAQKEVVTIEDFKDLDFYFNVDSVQVTEKIGRIFEKKGYTLHIGGRMLQTYLIESLSKGMVNGLLPKYGAEAIPNQGNHKIIPILDEGSDFDQEMYITWEADRDMKPVFYAMYDSAKDYFQK